MKVDCGNLLVGSKEQDPGEGAAIASRHGSIQERTAGQEEYVALIWHHTGFVSANKTFGYHPQYLKAIYRGWVQPVPVEEKI